MSKKKLTGLTDKYWITDFNYLDEVRGQFNLPDRAYIHDVTLREAEQAPHVVLRPDEKMRIFQALDDMGVHSVEIFPLVSDDDKELAKEMVKMPRQAKVFFLCRWNEWEIDFALEAGADGVVIECAGNPWLNKTFFGMSEDETIERLVRVAAYAKKNGIFTTTMPWDDYLAPMPFLERMYKSLVYDAGVDHVVIADTHGFGLPWTTAYIIGKMREWVPGTPIEMHAHNDYGLATAAMLSAVVGGASVVHTSINALGERSGNAAIRKWFKEELSKTHAGKEGDVLVHPVINVDGDKATGKWLLYMMYSYPRTGQSLFWVQGFYIMKYVREKGKWKISYMNWEERMGLPGSGPPTGLW